MGKERADPGVLGQRAQRGRGRLAPMCPAEAGGWLGPHGPREGGDESAQWADGPVCVCVCMCLVGRRGREGRM